MSKKNKKKNSVSKKGNIESSINKAISNLKPPYPVKQVIKKLGIKDQRSKKIARNFLKQLNQEYTSAGQSKRAGGSGNFITGKVDFVNPRYAYIVSEQTEKDVIVSSRNLNYAFDDDIVKVEIIPTKKKGRIEGKVIEIVERHRDEFVGLVQKVKSYAFVIPDFRKMHQDIFVHEDKSKGAKANDKVVVKITQWPDKNNKNPEGEIVEILGQSGDHETEMHSIIHEFGLPYKFPAHVLKESEKISTKISRDEIERRRDMRDITTFTIDPEDAKDFDDALSFLQLENGNMEVGIHIADVSHYLKEDTSLDKEAVVRGTSVYLVDRTIPMLPEKLSNELCSLRPHEDKLCFSAVFELDKDAKIMNEWFGRTVIHSDRRFTYEEAQERIETISGDFCKEITILNELALKLRVERFMRGSINFETTEYKFVLDEKGKPLETFPKERKDAHKLIEDFMLLANKRVAEFIYKKNNPTFVYRTHDYPDPEKLKVFAVFAQKFGYKLHLEEAAISKSLNNLIEDIEGKPEQNVLQTLAIRSMAKAKYSTEPNGHFGLAFPHYSHFTSPIRRYPDVMVHRLLDHYLQKGKSPERGKFEDLCLHTSDLEKRASDAERASIKYKQVEFMSDRLGEDFDGIISGVTEWGIYVELIETRCEGMVRLADLSDDYYYYDEENYRIVGQSTGNIFTLGDDMKVKVISTDINRRTIDLELVEHNRKV